VLARLQAHRRALAAPAPGDALRTVCACSGCSDCLHWCEPGDQGTRERVRARRARADLHRGTPDTPACPCASAARSCGAEGRKCLRILGCCMLTSARRLPLPRRAPPTDAPAAGAGGAEPAAAECVGPAHLALQPVAGRQRGSDVHRGAQRAAPAPRGRPVGHAGLRLIEGPAAALGAAQAARVGHLRGGSQGRCRARRAALRP